MWHFSPWPSTRFSGGECDGEETWEEPAEPNDYILNYTVTITDISTGTELSRTVVLDVYRYTILTETLGMTCEDMCN